MPRRSPAAFQGACAGHSRPRCRASVSCCWWLSIGIIYLVLGILYESFIHPLTILSGLPAAGMGALLALLVCKHRPQHLYAFVGIILLIGIVKKNAIMMIDFAIQLARGEGMAAAEPAIYRGLPGALSARS